MKNFKKILSLALAALMIMSTFAVSTSAKNFTDVPSDYKYAEQINIISDIGVTVGTSATEYSPETPVARDQMALLLYRLMVGNDNAGKVNTTPFTDLRDPTYNGAISWAYANGYILGTSATKFDPAAGITLQDAMTMLVRILGHENDKMVSGYPWTYINSAVKLDLDVELEDVDYTKTLTRGETAALLFNALTAEYIIPKTAANGATLFETSTIIEKIFGYKLEEATIVATNDYSTGAAQTVVKDGYVSLSYEDANGDSKMITVPYADLGLDGSANANLGKRVKVIYSIDSAKNAKVLGATEIGREDKLTDGIEVLKKNDAIEHIEIDGVKYQVVEQLSDKLSTNANELLVFAYDNDEKLTQITSNEALAAILGVYEARVIFDNRSDEVASRIIIKPYGFDKLEISGKGEYNIADSLKADELEGGITNTAKADDGDFVLYYFNEANKSLEIASVVPVSAAQTVNRLTETTVRLGNTTYELGCEALGITAESIKRQLTVGEKVRVVAVNGMILAISDGIEAGSASNYLITLTESRPVFTNGTFGYAVKVNIDGNVMSVFSETEGVVAGKAYRYTVNDDGVYTLIPYVVNSGIIDSGNHQFVQNANGADELAVIVEEANGVTLTDKGASYEMNTGISSFVSSSEAFQGNIDFITGKETVIIVGDGDGSYTVRKGEFDGSITVEDGAYVAAIFDNEIGNVEAIRYLYISNGSIGGATSTVKAVKVLEYIGIEYVDGKVYAVYNTLNLDTGNVEQLNSVSTDLVPGNNYKLNNDGTVSAVSAEIAGGIITGYTNGTVTIGTDTFALAENVNIFEIDEDFDVKSLKLSSAYMSNVEYITNDGKVTSIIVLGDAPLTASYNGSEISVTCGFELDGITGISMKSLRHNGKTVDITDFNMNRSGKDITIIPDEALAAGKYELTLNIGGGTSSVEFTVAE